MEDSLKYLQIDPDFWTFFVLNYLDISSLLRLHVNRKYRNKIFGKKWWINTFGYIGWGMEDWSKTYRLRFGHKLRWGRRRIAEFDLLNLRNQHCINIDDRTPEMMYYDFRFGPMGLIGPRFADDKATHPIQSILDEYERDIQKKQSISDEYDIQKKQRVELSILDKICAVS